MEVEKVQKLISNDRGNALPLACVIVVVLLLTSTVIIEYLRLSIIADNVRDALRSSAISVATENYDEVYNSLREGYSGGYIKTEQDVWQQALDIGDIYFELDKILDLDDIHIKWAGQNQEYKLSNLRVNVMNTPLAPNDASTSKKLKVQAQIMLEVPLSFGWGVLPPLKINIINTAIYVPKF